MRRLPWHDTVPSRPMPLQLPPDLAARARERQGDDLPDPEADRGPQMLGALVMAASAVVAVLLCALLAHLAATLLSR